MAVSVVLLRGINLGSTNRIAMPALREALQAAGYDNVRTYVQSGNVVLSSEEAPDALASHCHDLILQDFGLDIDVVARTRDELAQVVGRNPLEDVATEPKRYQVSFLSGKPGPDLEDKLLVLAAETERVRIIDREIYAWHPNGVARSKLWNKLASRGGVGAGLTATARNWTTVTTLLEMADGD
ncbi:MAG TPA: DUF1697 domain-containing protein [Solirubrobacteraceae bacterium]|nr:DUF1697 domain-containing protein [Solirubrobacteraceae bacterium]